jgi:hypothetical protein
MPTIATFGAASARGFGSGSENTVLTPQYTQGFSQTGQTASGTTITKTLTTPAQNSRWIMVSCINSTGSTTNSNTIEINGSTTYLGNVGNVNWGGNVSDGAQGNAYINQTICRIPTGNSVSVKITNTDAKPFLFVAAIFLLPSLNLTVNSEVIATGANAGDTQSVNQVDGGFLIGATARKYTTNSSIAWSGLTKIPYYSTGPQGSVNVNDPNAFLHFNPAYNFSTTTGATDVGVTMTDNSNGYMRVTIYSTWMPS